MTVCVCVYVCLLLYLCIHTRKYAIFVVLRVASELDVLHLDVSAVSSRQIAFITSEYMFSVSGLGFRA